MNSIKYIIAVAVLGLFLSAISKAREIQFTTVPEVVRTTVFHKYHITSPEKVVRVVEEPDNIYELTILTDSGQQIVYVKADGTIVERPGGVVETTRGESESAEVTVTMDEIQGGGERYVFVQDQGPDAIYIDHQTNKRVIVKGGAGKGGRTKEGSQTDIRTNERTTEKSQTDVRTNEQNRGGVRTEERNQQPGNMREDQRNADKGKKDMREDQKTQTRNPQGEQRNQGNRESAAPGNGQEEKNASQRNNNGEQREKSPGEQQNQEKSKGKAKASATP